MTKPVAIVTRKWPEENEKRLKEEKNELIEIDSKYYETEKQSNEDLNGAKNKLKFEIDKVKELINQKKNEEAVILLDNCKIIIEEYADSYSKNQNIKKSLKVANIKNRKGYT